MQMYCQIEYEIITLPGRPSFLRAAKPLYAQNQIQPWQPEPIGRVVVLFKIDMLRFCPLVTYNIYIYIYTCIHTVHKQKRKKKTLEKNGNGVHMNPLTHPFHLHHCHLHLVLDAGSAGNKKRVGPAAD